MTIRYLPAVDVDAARAQWTAQVGSAVDVHGFGYGDATLLEVAGTADPREVLLTLEVAGGDPPVFFQNSGGALDTGNARRTPMRLAPLSSHFGARPTPPCRVCNQGRSGLPGDDHTACNRQERALFELNAQLHLLPDMVAARAATQAARDNELATYERLLRQAGVAETLVATAAAAYWEDED